MMMTMVMMMMVMMVMILIFKTSGFLSPRPDTEKLGFAGVLLRLTFVEVDICFDCFVNIVIFFFFKRLLDTSSNMPVAASFISKTWLKHPRLDCFFPK